ncbi:MAG: lipopolysaccharide biosynthesis protein [Planctomycetota bacterium]|jgi:O-antigen/teichoic acid export membrane protein
MSSFREILKHSSVYAVGQILSRIASVLLLPLYTRCLSTADYGCVAILDLTAGILAILIGAGMAQAVVRFHFDSSSDDERSRVWWTGLIWVTAAATCVVGPMLLGRGLLAELTLGSDVTDGAFFYVLAAATLWMNTVGELMNAYLRVRKWSGLFVVCSLGRLLLNIGLNVWLLVGLELGITGLLTGNLIAAVANTAALTGVFVVSMPFRGLSVTVLGRLLSFGSPLIIKALLALMMHEADRYLLRTFGNLEQVGVYSLAYKVGQAVNMLCLVPFASIWNVVMYEIAMHPDARQTYASVFRNFVNALLVVMLAASLFACVLLPSLTPGDFAGAIDLIPIVLLAFVFFSMHAQFSVPALLAKKTSAMIPASLAGVVVNIVANVALIPRFGAAGAAWASVLTYATFSFGGLWTYRQLDRYPYPFARLSVSACLVGASFAAVRYGVFPQLNSLPAQLLIATVVTGFWAILLCGPAALPVIEIVEQKTGRRLIPKSIRRRFLSTAPHQPVVV